MAILSAIFSMLGRKLGQLLRAVFGWSITGLFGRLPQGKQTAVSIALLMSVVWPLLVVGIFVPSVTAWAMAFLPLERWLGSTVLRIIWFALALVVPIAVGMIVVWVAPSDQQRGSKLRTLLSGFPLTLGFAISFLMTVFIVPVLKLHALVKGWNDEHVYLQVKPDAFDDIFRHLARACESVGIRTIEGPVPAVMALPTRVLKWFARGGLDPVVADDPRRLRGDDIALYLYPADLLVRGTPKRVARVRAALVREFNAEPAHLVSDPVAQRLEDQMQRLWSRITRHDSADEVGAMATVRLREITHDLDGADLPYEEWILLSLKLHQLERAITGAPRIVDVEQLEPLPPAARERPSAPMH